MTMLTIKSHHLLAAIIALSCLTLLPAAQERKGQLAPAAPEVSPVEGGTYVNQNSAFSLKIPEGWTAYAVQTGVPSASAQPKTAEDFFAAGLKLQQAGDHEKAVEAYRSALKLDAKHFGAQVNSGVSYMRKFQQNSANRADAYLRQSRAGDGLCQHGEQNRRHAAILHSQRS